MLLARLKIVVPVLPLVLAAREAFGAAQLEAESAVVSSADDPIPVAIRATGGAGNSIQAFVLAIAFDALKLEIADLSPAGDWLASSPPDYVKAVGTTVSPGDPGAAGLILIADFEAEGGTKAIPPEAGGGLQTVARLMVVPKAAWPPHKPEKIDFKDGAARFETGHRMMNSLVIEGMDFYSGSLLQPLVLTSGSVQILLRGDSNADGAVDISDAGYTVNFLYLGGPPPPCPELADANNDGEIDISDPVFTINFLFLGGVRPADASSCL